MTLANQFGVNLILKLTARATDGRWLQTYRLSVLYQKVVDEEYMRQI